MPPVPGSIRSTSVVTVPTLLIWMVCGPLCGVCQPLPQLPRDTVTVSASPGELWPEQPDMTSGHASAQTSSAPAGRNRTIGGTSDSGRGEQLVTPRLGLPGGMLQTTMDTSTKVGPQVTRRSPATSAQGASPDRDGSGVRAEDQVQGTVDGQPSECSECTE